MKSANPVRSGVLLIDKPAGMTSHDVVAQLRRKLGTRRIGHAGTLDPMATGLLVVLVEQATKLEPFLVSAHKTYRAGVALGRSTSTLDAEGETELEAEPPPAVVDELAAAANDLARAPLLAAALAREAAREHQVPPVYSAIHVAGERSHRLARRGEQVDLPPRPVAVQALTLLATAASPPRIDVELAVSKGYYVRSFARDLGEALGCPAHLDRLVRTRAGAFELASAAPLAASPEELLAAMLSPARAIASTLPASSLDDEAVARVRVGKALVAADVAPELADGAKVALLIGAGDRAELVAIGERRGETIVVARGFTPEVSRTASNGEEPR